MNVNKLKGKIAECGKTQKDVAEHIGISETSMTAKMNERTAFLVTEANAIGEYLKLTNDEKIEIFLN